MKYFLSKDIRYIRDEGYISISHNVFSLSFVFKLVSLVSHVTGFPYLFSGLNFLCISEIEALNTQHEALGIWLSHADWWLSWLFIHILGLFSG